MSTSKKPKAVKAWASVWEDDGKPAICEISFYKDHLQSNLKHIRVLISPL